MSVEIKTIYSGSEIIPASALGRKILLYAVEESKKTTVITKKTYIIFNTVHFKYPLVLISCTSQTHNGISHSFTR